MLKKGTSIILAILLALSFTGCSQSGVNSTTNSGGTTDTIKQEETPNEEVILDNDTIKATYNGVTEMQDIGYFYVNLKLENKIDKEIWVVLESGDVDGESIPLIVTGMPVYIRSGNSYAATYGFPMTKLSINSVKDAKQATFKIVVRDKENITETIFESDLITIDLNK